MPPLWGPALTTRPGECRGMAASSPIVASGFCRPAPRPRDGAKEGSPGIPMWPDLLGFAASSGIPLITPRKQPITSFRRPQRSWLSPSKRVRSNERSRPTLL